MKIKYEANDGTLFDNEQACLAYEVPAQLQVYVEPGYIYQHKMPCSELCMHLGIHEKIMGIELLADNRAVQLWEHDSHIMEWHKFSAPVLASEVGLFCQDGWCFYTSDPIQAFQRYSIQYNRIEFQCENEHWNDEKWVCRHCMEECEQSKAHYKCADEQFSLGIYAGKYCQGCWNVSGYHKEGSEGFDPLDAGESYDSNY